MTADQATALVGLIAGCAGMITASALALSAWARGRESAHWQGLAEARGLALAASIEANRALLQALQRQRKGGG